MDSEQAAHGQETPVPNGEAGPEPANTHLTQITRAMVAIYKEQFGRGPRFAHSHYAGPDAIVCLLEGSLTPIERTLASLGEHQRLRDMRMFFQYAAEVEFRGAVERILDRRVVGFLSGIDSEADIASETFILA
jgi:uncharacterized protein YbcI